MEEATKKGFFKEFYQDLLVPGAKIVGLVIKKYTVGLPARIRLNRYLKYRKEQNRPL